MLIEHGESRDQCGCI